MPVRNRRSNAGPFAASSSFICASVSMPGISISCSTPFIFIFMPAGFASGTGCRRSRSQVCMVAISSCWALMIRSHRVRTDGLAPWVGAQPAMTMAWAWWPIMSDMKLHVRRDVRMAEAVGPGLGDGGGLAGIGAGWLGGGLDRLSGGVAAGRKRGDQHRGTADG